MGRITIGQAFKRFRDYKGWSIRDMCKILDIVPTTYKYEQPSCEGRSPTAGRVVNLALAGNVSTDYLLGLTDNPEPNWKNDAASDASLENEKSASTQQNLFAENDAEKIRQLQGQVDALQIQIDALRAALKAQGLKV